MVYVSKALTPFDDAALEELAVRAASRNVELGVTGYLCFEKGRFVQYIEGAAATVDELMRRIAADPRHDVLHQIHRDGDEERRFPSWHMRKLTRGDFVEIHLEHLLTDQILFLKKLPGNNASWEQAIWSMIERIAGLQSRLRRSKG